MPQRRQQPYRRSTECRRNIEGAQRLRSMPVIDGIEVEFTDTGIIISHANTPRESLNTKQLLEDIQHDGIAVEAQDFYCG